MTYEALVPFGAGPKWWLCITHHFGPGTQICVLFWHVRGPFFWGPTSGWAFLGPWTVHTASSADTEVSDGRLSRTHQVRCSLHLEPPTRASTQGELTRWFRMSKRSGFAEFGQRMHGTPSSRRINGGGYSHHMAPRAMQLGQGRIVPGFTRRSGYYGRFQGRRAGDANPELKFHDVDADQAAADLSAGVVLNTDGINLIAQGVTESTRVGRKCVIKSINWRGTLQLTLTAGATATAPQTVRLMVVLDKQANGVAPTAADVLGTAPDFQSYNFLANKSRFRTISDKVYDMNAQAGAGTGAANDFAAVNRSFEFYKKCDIPLEFSSTTGAIAEIRSNNIFLLIIASTATTSCTLDSKVRLRFSDG